MMPSTSSASVCLFVFACSCLLPPSHFLCSTHPMNPPSCPYPYPYPYPYPSPLTTPVPPLLRALRRSGEAQSILVAEFSLCIVGIALTVATYTYMLTWTYTGEVNAKRVRERYLKAILRQDVAYFDKVRFGFIQWNPHFLTSLSVRSAQEKSLRVFKQIHVSNGSSLR